MNSTDLRRVRSRNNQPIEDGLVVYWMQRDQRAEDNWALYYAQEQALARQVPLVVVFNLVPTFGHTTWRHYDFMCTGLAETEQALAAKNIPFMLLTGQPQETIPAFVKTYTVGEVVVDFNPLRFTQAWREEVATLLPVRLTEVDAHNIVPCWVASPKEEFAAYTLRPKLHKQLPEWLVDIPPIDEHPHTAPTECYAPIDWEVVRSRIDTNTEVLPVDWLTPGTKAGKKIAQEFAAKKLDQYNESRNDPTVDGQSNLSPYYHFGQLSAQWVARLVSDAHGARASTEAYLEELIVRRELADNYCFYNSNYDSVAGAHEWAQKTIAEHAKDKREHVYSQEQFDDAATHDELWNAMQHQLRTEGKLHGWCRMYWAKKILEWTPNVQTAIDIALYLNDRYNLDGTDPNGITGVMWSVAGVHDRAWTERPVFGKIRYMNFNGAKRKFDVAAYIDKHTPEETLF